MAKRNYETMFIVKPALTAEEVQAKFELVKNTITKMGGEICAVNDMGIRKLAYIIEKCERGHYFVVYFQAEGTAIPELERIYKVTEDIIRTIVIKYEKQVEVKAWQAMVDKTNGVVAKKEVPANESN